MDALLPVATAFDAVSGLVAAALYVIVAVAVLVRAPRDVRAHTFLLIAACSVVPYSMTTGIWLYGPRFPFTPGRIQAAAFSLVLGSVALFHFMQVFPWRRPWIRAHRGWLVAAYLALPVSLAVVFAGSASLAEPTRTGSDMPTLAEAVVIMAIVVPILFIAGVVLPFAGLLSLYKSWQEARRRALDGVRRTTLWMLISQLAGGVLTILIVPLLRLVAPKGLWVTIASALLFGFSLLMPLAFAAAVWKFRILDDSSMLNAEC